MNSFGAKLKQARLQAGLTQEQLAERMEVSTVAVQNWENGKNKVRETKLKKLSYFYNIPLEILIKEMLLSENDNLCDNFPYFLFDDDTNDLIRTLHLSLSQQELFGLLYIYHAEYLDRETLDSSTLREDLKKIPYEFISKFGSIQLLNIAEGLYHVLKYVKSDFLVKVLRLNPETEFNICTLPKELICEFIDAGYKKLDIDDFDAYDFYPLSFHINMHKAKKILPKLEKEPVHLTNGHWGNPLCEDVPLWLICYEDTISEYLKCRRNDVPEWYSAGEEAFKKEWDSYHNSSRILYEIESCVVYEENENAEWILSINENGRKLLRWFLENES